MIYQIHELNGRHIAYSPQEAFHNEKNGWKTVSEDEFYGNSNDNSDLIQAYVDKFGKKPHHKMKPETIQEKLDADRT